MPPGEATANGVHSDGVDSANPSSANTSTTASQSEQTPDRAGQTGSIGAAECQTDPDCDIFAQDQIASVGNASFGHRSASCDQTQGGNCLIIYTSTQGCSAEVEGPFFDCGLADAEIFERHHSAVTSQLCNPQAEACAMPAQPASSFFPRDASEWQGMLIDSALMPPCEQSASCGLARACVEGVCTRCTLDSHCAAGEGCVLDHCVRQELISCRRAADCGSGGLCLLSGYSGGTARGNEDMRSYCNGGSGGSAGTSSISP